MAKITPPDLDIRNAALLTAQAIARITTPPSVALIDSYITTLITLRDLVEAGNLPAQPLCAELSNANPSSPHTVLIEAFCWLLEQIAYRINQLPERDLIEFANLFLGDLFTATPAVTDLQFTTLGEQEVTVPAGTLVSRADDKHIFETVAELVVPVGETVGTVGARAVIYGKTMLAPNTLTKQVDQIAFVVSVTNPATVDSGSDAETTPQALERARNYQRRAERLVSARDYEEAVYEEVLRRNGIVKLFPFIKAGDWEGGNQPGSSTMIVMTAAGNPISDALKEEIRALFEAQGAGAQIISLLDGQYVPFNVEANVKITSFTSQQAAKTAIEANLRAFYAPKAGGFGRKILRSDIIAIIEGTEGVDRIEPANPAGPILVAPTLDKTLAPYELPKLVTVTINVVP